MTIVCLLFDCKWKLALTSWLMGQHHTTKKLMMIYSQSVHVETLAVSTPQAGLILDLCNSVNSQSISGWFHTLPLL